MYYYKSPIGMFKIERCPEGFMLSLNGDELDGCDSAQAAADNVYVHSTGLLEWDMLAGKIRDVPENIRAWRIG